MLPKRKEKLPFIINSSYHPRNPPIKTKRDAIKRCFELGESVKYVSEDIGYSRSEYLSVEKNISFERKNSINE